VPLAFGERFQDAQRPISGEGPTPGAAEACSGAGLRGWQGPRTSTFEAEWNGQRGAGGARGRGARQDWSIMLPMHKDKSIDRDAYLKQFKLD